MNLPNVISLARLLCVPLMVWLVLAGHLDVAFWVFVAAGVSDAVDGFLAKRFNWTTQLGGYLDPVADKALLVSIYVMLGARGMLPGWLVALVVLRDMVILGGAFLVIQASRDERMSPLYVSKANTALQIVLAGYALALKGFEFADPGIEPALIYGVAATTVISGVGYVLKWGRKANGVPQ